MAIMQITIIPLGTATASVGEHVTRVHAALRNWKVSCTLTDMGTIIEGQAEELFQLAARIHDVAMSGEVARVVTQVQIDDRRDKRVGLGDKKRDVQLRLEEMP